jgi:hypothetical protein
MFLKRFLFLIVVCLFHQGGYAQQSKEDKRILDSLIEHDEFLQLLNALDDNKSSLTISIGASNRLASINNNSINALQGNSRLIFTPGVSYTHKTGLGISALAYVLDFEGQTAMHRAAITPFYQYTRSDAFSFGLSYTRFFSNSDYNAVESPIQNDLYVNALYKKSFISPGLSVGYSSGKYKEIDQITINVPREGRTTFYDTAVTSVKSVSATGSIERQFVLHHKIAKRTALIFTPSLLLNAGNNYFDVEHKNNFAGVVRGRGRRQLFRNQSESTNFELRSAGLNLFFNYNTKAFSVQPQLYLDYFLPSTSENRFTGLYSVSVEYSL